MSDRLVQSLHRHLDTETRKRVSPRTLCLLGIVVWTVVCLVCYQGLQILMVDLIEGSSEAEGLLRLTPLIDAWWPFVWGVPVLIVAGVGLALRWDVHYKSHTKDLRNRPPVD